MRTSAAIRCGRSVAIAAALGALIASGCSGALENAASPASIAVACTTSVQDSGLLDALLPEFERSHPGIRVRVIAVGTGEALALGRRKDVDVLIVHAEDDEERFIAEGHGVERRALMRSDFAIVGPPVDPAGVRRARDVAHAMRAIATAKAAFISRGDRSGTHVRELALWRAAGIPTPTPGADGWYESAGLGMGEVLAIAAEKRAYTLADLATFRAMRSGLDLDVLYAGAAELTNVYGVVLVAGTANERGARAFFEWITSPAAANLIRSFGATEHGEPLFTPIAPE